MKAICRRCNRGLRDSKSIAEGIGPVCRKKERDENEQQIKLELKEQANE